MTWREGSKAGIRSAGFRGLEARLQRRHEVVGRLRLDFRHRRHLFSLDLRLDQRHEGIPESAPELRKVELRRQGAEELEGKSGLPARDHAWSCRGSLGRPL